MSAFSFSQRPRGAAPRAASRVLALAALLAVTALVSRAAAATYYVDPNCGDDNWKGISPTCAAPDGPKATIRAALLVAGSGDTLVLADGTYTGPDNRDLHLAPDVDLVIRSANGPAACIIDCQALGRFLTLDGGQTFATLLDGLTIQNGNAASAGAVLVSESSSLAVATCTFTNNQSGSTGGAISSSGGLFLSDSIFSGNTATSNAGAVYMQNNAAEFERCLFTGNSAANEGAVYAQSARLTCTLCTFEQNRAGTHDGAISADTNSTLTLTDCIVRDNVAGGCCGGGSAYMDSSVELVRCEFSGNSANGPSYAAGGFGIQLNSHGIVRDCNFSGNQTTSGGGGLWCGDSSTMLVTNTTFGGNSANAGGGMVVARDSSAFLDDCMFQSNQAANSSSYGGGLWCSDSVNVVVTNTTFRANSATYASGMSVLRNANNSVELDDCLFVDNVTGQGGGGALFNYEAVIDVANCTFTGNRGSTAGAVMVSAGSTDLTNCVLWLNTPNEITVRAGSATAVFSDVQGGWPGIGNIDADPLFVDPSNGDYRLQPGSPCVETGDPAYIPEPGETDLDGNLRLWDGDGNGSFIVDMGAYEFDAPIPGDLDGDCEVGLSDLAMLLSRFGTPGGMTPADGDLDFDSDVDLADLAALLSVYGSACP
ncbi:MAG: hypothetical protein AMXMBFR47_10010 [Planctomycetota bacterium]